MLDNTLKGYGQILVERGERRGEIHGERRAKLKDARNALGMGLSMEQAAQITEIPVDTLERLLNSPALTQ
jgi:predicted transposase/invertase (TIGR01784 family)